MNVDRNIECPEPSLINKIAEISEETKLPVRVCVSSSMENDLNLLESYFCGEGYRHVNRSHLVRLAVSNIISMANEEING